MKDRTSRARGPRPPTTCRLTLRIAEKSYTVRGFPAPCYGLGARGFRLHCPGSGATYHLAETHHGPTCDCPDQTFRHEGLDGRGCKHIRALVAVGLLAGFPEPEAPALPATHPCPHCHAGIPRNSSTCPRCGRNEFDA